MALSKVGSGASYDNGGTIWTSTAHTKDTGTASGDLGIIGIAWYEQGFDTALNAITADVAFVDQGTTVYNGSGGTESRLDIYTRAMTGTDGSAYTVSRSADMYATTQLLTLRGSSALSVVSVTVGTPGAGVTSVTAPSVSITSTQGIVCLFAVSDPAGTYTDPSGMTLGISEGSESTNSMRMYYESPGSGTTGTRTLSWTNTRDAIGATIIVEGANAAGGGLDIPIAMYHYQRMQRQ